MKRRTAGPLYLGALLALMLWAPNLSLGADSASKTKIPEGVYIELTRDFYETLRDEGGRGTRVYSNDPSVEYLRQMAISSRFMVETNLQILRLQEEILRLLNAQSGSNRK